MRSWLSEMVRDRLLAATFFVFAGLAVSALAAIAGTAFALPTGHSQPAVSTRVAILDLTADETTNGDGHAGVANRLRAARSQGAAFAVIAGPILSGTELNEGFAGEDIPGPTTGWLGELARSLQMWIVLPIFERQPASDRNDRENAPRGKPPNPSLTLVLIGPTGEVELKSRAVLTGPSLGGVPIARGNYRDTLRSVDTDGLRVGLLAENDAMTGIMRLSDRGADIIFIAANRLDRERRDHLLDLAREAKVRIAVANIRDVNTVSGFVADADGAVTVSAADDHPGIADIAPLPRGSILQSKLGLPKSVPIPNRRPVNQDLVELGRQIFTDPQFSSTGEIACSSCHRPEQAFTTRAPRGSGVYGRQSRRNVPSILNVAFRPLLRWDGYASSLENFVKYPMSGRDEMNFHYLDRAIPYLQKESHYSAVLNRLFGNDPIEFEQVEYAIATYLRTLLSGNSAFDRFYYGGDSSALTQAEQRGLAVFSGKGHCAECHQIGRRAALFTDYDYHDLGVGWSEEQGAYADIGLGGISSAEFNGKFLTPSLRDVALTAPYMHDGSIATLEEVIEFFDRGGNQSVHRDPRLMPLHLSAQEKSDLLAFLNSLTGDAAWNPDGRPRASTAASVN